MTEIAVGVRGSAAALSGELYIILPEVEAANMSGWGIQYANPVGIPLKKAATQELDGVTTTRLTATVTIPVEGAFRVFVGVTGGERILRDGAIIGNDTYVRRWLFITDMGGGLFEQYDPRRVPPGFHVSVGPFRRRALSKTTGGLSLVAEPTDPVYRALYFDPSVSMNLPATGGVSMDGTMFEIMTGNPVGGAPGGQVGPDGTVTIACPGPDYEYQMHFGYGNAQAFTHQTSTPFSVDWGECFNTWVTDWFVDEALYRSLTLLDQAATVIEGTLGVDRSRLEFVVDPGETANCNPPGFACFVRADNRIRLPSLISSPFFPFALAHEFIHALQWESFGGIPPVTNCKGHQPGTRTWYDCAFVEGLGHFGGFLAFPAASAVNFEFWGPSGFGIYDEGNVAAFLTDLIDSSNEPGDAATLPGSYLGSILATCRAGGMVPVGIDEIIYCLENQIDPTIVGLMDKELRGPYSENAVEPVGWSQLLIRNTWRRSIFGLEAQ